MSPASMMGKSQAKPPPTRKDLTDALLALLVANTATTPVLLDSEISNEAKSDLSEALLTALMTMGRVRSSPNAVIEVQMDPGSVMQLAQAIKTGTVTELYEVIHRALDAKVLELAERLEHSVRTSSSEPEKSEPEKEEKS